MSKKHEYAVYAEFSPGDEPKPVKSGWNTRVFTEIDVEVGESISYDKDAETGHIKLMPGLYHITASSIVTYNFVIDDPEVEQNPGWPTKVIPNGAYSRLREVSDTSDDNGLAICLGTMCSANMTPSLVDTYFETDKSTEILLEHQSGFEPEGVEFVEGVYLQDRGGNGSPWHVFSRITIRKID